MDDTGVAVLDFLSPLTLVVKVAGLVLALGAQLSIGKEGPFVHMAAIVATMVRTIFE
jgi:H+/Cl- antiporter ClcA